MTTERTDTSFLARAIRMLSAPIILAWLAIAALLTFAVPSLEQVGKERAAPIMADYAPSVRAMKRIGEVFQESESDSTAMIVLEGDQPLGDAAHHYYDLLIRQLDNDPTHVRHVEDFWSDPLTAAGVQSADGKAAYVQVNLAGNEGEDLANESVRAVQGIVARTPAPPGVKAYVTGWTPLITDEDESGNQSVLKITVVSIAAIFTMLFLVYRSVTTVALLLVMVGVELLAARGIVAVLALHGWFRLSTFAVTLVVALAIAAGTDYGIFFFGRYHEARQAGEDRETAYYTTYRGVAKVVLASGLTIAGAVACLSFTRMPYFQTLGAPCAVGMLVSVAVALTLVPAALAVGGRFGLFEPKRTVQVHGWRRVGTAIVRWPGPILAATVAVALIGLLTLPGYRASYNLLKYLPDNLPSGQGFAAAERHFSPARMMPELLMVETDRDLRNPADFLVLDRLTKRIFGVEGVSRVQAITRPEGTPLEHSSIPFQLSMQNAAQRQNMKFEKDRIDDMVTQADELTDTIAAMRRMQGLMQQLAGTTHATIGRTHEVVAVTDELRDHIADFDDFWRPVRNYFYWEQHCYDVPICWSLRSLFDAMDGVDQLDENLHALSDNLDNFDVLMPQMIAQFSPMIATMESVRTMLLTMHSTMSGIFEQMEELSGDATAMGKAFDAARNDDSFYLPPEVFANPDFQRAMKFFLSPDGKAVRMIITHRGDPAAPEAIPRIGAIRTATAEALKGTPLEHAKVYLTGTAAINKDQRDGSSVDLLIAGVASLCLIFIIMLIITRSLVAAAVIVGTVALSLGASFGLSVLVWQYLLGIDLHWLVLAMSVIILLAVGSDYNLLLVSRLKEELGAGIKTGLIRAVGGTGKVVTSAGLVFAFTMASMVVSDLRIIGQVGTTIGLGLLFDTLVVRAFMTPSIAALLGRWFWWPQRIRPRPASYLLRPYAPRPVVRRYLLPQEPVLAGVIRSGAPAPGGGRSARLRMRRWLGMPLALGLLIGVGGLTVSRLPRHLGL
ncbi:RND family transporter [Mycobacterium talmoniae]|nr:MULTISPECIES: RND family transporter [Mycobacterium]TDH57159.1 RND family transporter [Mycobacterium eburneum]